MVRSYLEKTWVALRKIKITGQQSCSRAFSEDGFGSIDRP
jgi:hypothetical protein